MSKRARDNLNIIYRAYTARRVQTLVNCGEEHWVATSKYFAHRKDAETYMMNQFVSHFATLDVQWFHEHGIEHVEDTYDAYCDVMDCWMREHDFYDYCIEEIELH